MHGKNERARTSAVRQVRPFVVAAAFVGAWLALFGGLVSSVDDPMPLSAAIERVLNTPTPAQPAPSLVAAVVR